MKLLKLFIASGSDLKEERDKVVPVLIKVDKSHPQVKIEPVKWDTDLPSGSVKEPRIQAAINPVLDSCDMVLVLVYARLGPYTREEYNLALEKGKKIFVYFKTGFSPKNRKEHSEYGKVLRFKEEIERENRILFKEYGTITEFESLLSDDLNLYIALEYQNGDGVGTTALGAGVEKKKTRAIALTALPARTVKLVGRDLDLERLHERLNTEDRVLLVQGIGGAGKTELCKHYLWLYMDEYHYTGWIDYRGSLEESFAGQFRVPGPELPVEGTVKEQFQRIHRYLSGLDKDTLLVVDNIDDPNDPDLLALAAYRFKVMANSRCRVEGFSQYDIEFLSEAACKELFYLHYKGEPNPGEVKEVEVLIRRAGYHTLAVELLARTAGAAGLVIKDLNQKLDQVGFDLDGAIKENISTQWRNEKVKRTFFQHLAQVFDLSRLAEEEKLILCNISVMPGLPLEIADLKEWLGLESADVLNGLVEKGWLKRIGNRVEMHAVIGEVVRIKEKPDVVKCRQLIDSLQWLFHSEPWDNPLEKRDYVAVGESVVNRLNADDRYLAALANNLSLIYKDLGQPERAQEFQEKALKIRETILDKNHPALAQSYNNLAMIYRDLGQPERALEFQEKALRILEAVLDKNHPDLARLYHNSSLVYKAFGQPKRALEFQEKALKIREAVLDKNHPDLAQSYHNQAGIYLSMGKFEEALEYQEKALRIIEKSLPENHPLAAESYINLSLILKSIGRLDEALDYGKKGVEILKKLLPGDNPRLKSAVDYVGLIRSILGK
jgi:tetratricopeptide (TPR) repeat protein